MNNQLPDSGGINKAINTVQGLRNPPALTGRAAQIRYATNPDEQQEALADVAGMPMAVVIVRMPEDVPAPVEEQVIPEELTLALRASASVDPTRLEAPEEIQDPVELEQAALEEKRRAELEMALAHFRLEEERRREEERLRALKARNRKRRI